MTATIKPGLIGCGANYKDDGHGYDSDESDRMMVQKHTVMHFDENNSEVDDEKGCFRAYSNEDSKDEAPAFEEKKYGKKDKNPTNGPI
ncbi:hypothetical protein PoB_005268800 [Plakobranchus ocellatus]|uniref:Uncharacterized protein n=1 Tax=Plakobranchus ocellatus TaxID=259542 RepID=A0AAV4C2Q2_9GAST|nr:hypothetical protein PoB_005268800 [Plakobranchus ocellatus]